MHPVECIFKSLEGSWTLSRTISGQGTMEGRATFTRDPTTPGALYFREDVTFTEARTASKTDAFREYYFRLIDNQISVFFAETPRKFFHTLRFCPPTAMTATATHLCGNDCYDATYTFTSPDAFSLFYKVRGPAKDYTIFTLFKRSI